jgi:hypothetical protein
VIPTSNSAPAKRIFGYIKQDSWIQIEKQCRYWFGTSLARWKSVPYMG